MNDGHLYLCFRYKKGQEQYDVHYKKSKSNKVRI